MEYVDGVTENVNIFKTFSEDKKKQKLYKQKTM